MSLVPRSWEHRAETEITVGFFRGNCCHQEVRHCGTHIQIRDGRGETQPLRCRAEPRKH